MYKHAGSKDNSITRLPIPMIGDINNRRFLTAVLSGVVGGAGISAAANLLRSYVGMRKKDDKDTNEDTIVLTVPKKAEDGYTSMRDARTGEYKVTTNGGRQFRDSGRYGKSTGAPKEEKKVEKCAEGNPGPNTVGTVVANTIGLTAGGLLSYEVVSRLFDKLNERRLKRKLEAAQKSYINALSGESKRAEMVNAVLDPVEHVILKEPMAKEAGIGGWISDRLPDSVTNTVRYPAAMYVLALLAGTGATAYVTKKIMDREFPEEKLKKDINKPTRIVFKTVKGRPAIVEGEYGQEKEASAETCAAITAMLPIYMDVVEGSPNRTLSEPYVKIAESAGTDAHGLLKLAKDDMTQVYRVILQDKDALMAILKGTGFGTDFSKRKAIDALKKARPETYAKAVDAAIDSRFASKPTDGFIRRSLNGIQRAAAKGVAAVGGRDWMVDKVIGKSAEVGDMFSASNVLQALRDAQDDESEEAGEIDTKDVIRRVKSRLSGRRRVSIEAADRNAARYMRNNKEAIKKLLSRMSAKGSI